MRRIAPDEHAAMRQRLADAMGEEFDSRLGQRLAEHHLTGNADAARQPGVQSVVKSPARSWSRSRRRCSQIAALRCEAALQWQSDINPAFARPRIYAVQSNSASQSSFNVVA
ncbi:MULTISPECIES: hypothetical protein [Bradyrhizobium]|uniref:hypothetical protein n=1 Tax=Bradyrhizobium TaxID=374 RepID=UPI001E412725|nr:MULTISPECIES: hypothetical protein [Bradyrhizobium]